MVFYILILDTVPNVLSDYYEVLFSISWPACTKMWDNTRTNRFPNIQLPLTDTIIFTQQSNTHIMNQLLHLSSTWRLVSFPDIRGGIQNIPD
jgi:hypothetical protein